MVNKFIRNFVAKQIAGRSDDGIMITLKDPQRVTFAENILADLLMRNGIDPTAITSEAQLKTILNQIKSLETQAIRNTDVSGIRGTRQAEVFNIEGQPLDPNKPIIGGTQTGKELSKELSDRLAVTNTQRMKQKISDKKIDDDDFDLEKGLNDLDEFNVTKDAAKAKQLIDDQPPPGSRGGADDIAAPVQSSEESLKNMIEAENKKNITAMKKRKMLDEAIQDASPGFSNDTKYDAELVAENLAERMGLVYDDLPTKQRLDLYDQAYTGLSKQRFKGMKKPDDDPEEFQKGGIARIGLASGTIPGGYDKNAYKYIREIDMDIAKAFKKYKAGGGKLDFDTYSSEAKRAMFDRDIPTFKADGGRIGLKEGLTPEQQGPMGPVFTTSDPKEAAKEVVKRLIKIEDADIPVSDKLRISLQGLDKATVQGVIKILGGELFFGAGKQGSDKGIGINFYKSFQKGGIARIGLKDGPKMSRRTFLKFLSGAVALPIIGKFFKPVKGVGKVAKVPMIKTGDAVGKPEWFDSLVNKVILEGDDVSKKFATKDREIVHRKKIDEDSEVIVTQDLEDGTVRVDYDSPENMGQDRVMLQYKPGMADETTGGKKPRDRFDATEAEPRFVGGPEDADIEFDSESGGPGLKFLESDVSKLKQYATGKGPTMKEFIKSKKRKDYVAKINDDSYEAAQHISGKYGDGPEPDFPDDYDGYRSGGIAGMLGE